jgi:hypothetical protein
MKIEPERSKEDDKNRKVASFVSRIRRVVGEQCLHIRHNKGLLVSKDIGDCVHIASREAQRARPRSNIIFVAKCHT